MVGIMVHVPEPKIASYLPYSVPAWNSCRPITSQPTSNAPKAKGTTVKGLPKRPKGPRAIGFGHLLWGELFERCNIGFWPEDKLDVILGQRVSIDLLCRTGNHGAGQRNEQYKTEQNM